MIERIGFNGELNSKARESLVSIGRLVMFLQQTGLFDMTQEQRSRFKSISRDIRVLVDIDETSYQGGTNGANHPMSWYHDFDVGRAFYTGLGHDNKSWEDPLYLQHVLGGIQYAMGIKMKTKQTASVR